MTELQNTIESAWENRAQVAPASADAKLRAAVAEVIARLDAGTLRVAEKAGADWVTHQWVKKAVLLSFRIEDNAVVRDGYTNYFDKVPAKFADYGSGDFKSGGFRVVPPAAVRRGAFIARNVVLMPSFVNIGAFVDEGTMVDTWATVGSWRPATSASRPRPRARPRGGGRSGRAPGPSARHRARLRRRTSFVRRRGHAVRR
jgi:2,3,4,5-tetrahydropyridine-2-carboxylate N-succinyltransferase